MSFVLLSTLSEKIFQLTEMQGPVSLALDFFNSDTAI